MKIFSQGFIIFLLACNWAQAAISTKTLTVRATVVKPCQITWGAPIIGATQQRSNNCEIAVNMHEDNRDQAASNPAVVKPFVVQPKPPILFDGKEAYIVERAIGEITIKF